MQKLTMLQGADSECRHILTLSIVTILDANDLWQVELHILL